jgi:3-methyladenine DNA glycosylase/8-oxoguanine DNA glycosylase
MTLEAPRASVDTAVAATVYAPRHELDLARTMAVHYRGTGDPTCRTTPEGIWRTVRTPVGAATLLLRQRQHGIEARAWGAGAHWLIERVPALLGEGDDWSELSLHTHPGLAEVHRRNPGMRLSRTGLMLEALVPAIIEQKVTTLEAHRAWYRLIRIYGDAAPGPAPATMHVAPHADVWRTVPSWQWHRAGVDPQRSRTVVSACQLATALERTSVVDAETAAKRLQTVPGVGRWTAAETTQRTHADPDAVSVGDYHLAAHVGYALTGSPVDDNGMLELLEPWRGHRQRVVRLILASGFAKPRHGPRMTIQDHRRH